MIAGGFSDVFWPTLWATLIGVGIGIPIGLFLDRHRRAAESKAARQSSRDVATHALDVARSAIENDVRAARDLQTSLQKPGISLDTEITTGDWEAVRVDVLRGLQDDPALRGRLGSFFDELGRLVDHHELLREYTIGIHATLSGSSEIRQEIRDGEIKRIDAVIENGTAILEGLDSRAAPS